MHYGLGRRVIEQGPMAAPAAPAESVSSPVTSPCSEIGHCEGERLLGTAAEIKPGLAAASRSQAFWTKAPRLRRCISPTPFLPTQ